MEGGVGIGVVAWVRGYGEMVVCIGAVRFREQGMVVLFGVYGMGDVLGILCYDDTHARGECWQSASVVAML